MATAGRVVPKHYLTGDGVTRGSVTIRVYKFKPALASWVLTKSAVRLLGPTSAFRWSWRPRATGRYRLKAFFLGDADHSQGFSRLRYVEVY